MSETIGGRRGVQGGERPQRPGSGAAPEPVTLTVDHEAQAGIATLLAETDPEKALKAFAEYQRTLLKGAAA